jgi:hypothetical protein
MIAERVGAQRFCSLEDTGSLPNTVGGELASTFVVFTDVLLKDIAFEKSRISTRFDNACDLSNNKC